MKKKIIIGILIAALIVSGTAGGAVYYRKSHQSEVSVVSVDSLASEYYTDDTSLEGNIATSAVQNISVDKDMIVKDVYVSKGDAVKKGDKLIAFDMTLVQMELKIAKLKQEQQEQKLVKAQKRLTSLQNGGPVEESDGDSGTADSTKVSDTDTTSYGDELAMNGSLSGTYLAAIINPILAAAITESAVSESEVSETNPQTVSSEEETADADVDVDFGSGDIDGGDTEITPSPEPTGTPELTPELTPTVTPTPDVSQDDFVDNIKVIDTEPSENKDALIDGESQFLQVLDDESEPITGTGTEEDPFVFLCDSKQGYVTAKGSFLNKMAQFNEDGTRDADKTGYWYQLEFHQDDKVADFQNRKASCIGYYLIDGNLLDKRVDNDSEIEYSLADANQYEADSIPDDWGNDAGGDPGTASISREEAIKIQKSRIESLKLDIRASKLNVRKLEKKVKKETIYSKLDGIVAKVGDSATVSSDGGTFMSVKSKEGYYVRGTVSELMLDQVQEGTELKCSTSNGDFNAKVAYVSEYPVSSDSSSYYGSGNPNASYYEYTATIEDSSVKVSDDDWLTVMLAGNVVSNGIVLDRAFVRTENGISYVYKDDNGVLKKQILKVGGNVNSGYSVLVTGGITREDKIAFPYGDDVRDGAKTKEVSSSEMYGY